MSSSCQLTYASANRTHWPLTEFTEFKTHKIVNRLESARFNSDVGITAAFVSLVS